MHVKKKHEQKQFSQWKIYLITSLDKGSFIFIKIDNSDIIDNNDKSTILYYAFKIYIKKFQSCSFLIY